MLKPAAIASVIAQLALIIAALSKVHDKKWIVLWLAGVLGLLDGASFFIKDPRLLLRKAVDGRNSGYMKEYMLMQFTLGIIIITLWQKKSDAIYDFGILYSTLLFGAVLFHIQSVLMFPEGWEQQVAYIITDAACGSILLWATVTGKREKDKTK